MIAGGKRLPDPLPMLGYMVREVRDGAQFAMHEAKVEARELLRNRENPTPWQPLSLVIAAAVAPVPAFILVYYSWFSWIRFYHPLAATVLSITLPLIVSCLCLLQATKNMRLATPSRGLLVLAAGFLGASVAGAALGEQNFWWYSTSYYTYQDLAFYLNIDPSESMGQSYMDAGQIYFQEASYVAVDEMTVFKSDGTYCVAPIMSKDSVQPTAEDAKELKQNFVKIVDFWAVGINCCDQESGKFWCGDVENARARSGLRLLRDDVRPFYALAVQEWEAGKCPEDENTARGVAQASPLVCPRARHPLFFHWSLDPYMDVEAFYENSWRLFGMHSMMYFLLNLLVALSLFWALFLLGFK